jgi:exopolysaccharide biosynthesis polyprenyl glycosylphosphotransferase
MQSRLFKKQAIKHLAVLDAATAIGAWAVFWAYNHYRSGTVASLLADVGLSDWLIGLLAIPCFWLLLYLLSGTYFDLYQKSRLHEINRTLISSIIGCIIVSVFLISNASDTYAYFVKITSRYLMIHTLFALSGRLLILGRVRHNIASGKAGFNTLIIGGSQQAVSIYRQILQSPKVLGNVFKGFIYSSQEATNGMSRLLPQLGHLGQLEQIIDEHHIEEVIVAVDSAEHHLLENILTRLCYRPVLIKVLPDLYDIISGSVKTSNVYDAVLIHIYPDLMPDWQRVCKRAIDIVVSLSAIICLMPLFAFAAWMVRRSSPGTIFYKQQRIGLFGKPFFIYKFRSMYASAEANGPALSSKQDPRTTSWGRIMRKWRIDEIPQFFNILKGDMSLVGPRPERKHFIDLIAHTHPHYKYLHKVKPGLTSWGMVQYGYAENVAEMISRMKYDLLYIENCSLVLDLKIILYTFKVILQGRGK